MTWGCALQLQRQVTTILLDQRSFQEGWPDRVWSSVNNLHTLKFFNAILVTIWLMVPPEDGIVADTKLESHGVPFSMESFKSHRCMFQDSTSSPPRRRKTNGHMLFCLNFLKHYWTSIQFVQIFILKVLRGQSSSLARATATWPHTLNTATGRGAFLFLNVRGTSRPWKGDYRILSANKFEISNRSEAVTSYNFIVLQH